VLNVSVQATVIFWNNFQLHSVHSTTEVHLQYPDAFSKALSDICEIGITKKE